MSRSTLLKAACAVALLASGAAQAEILVGINAGTGRLVAFDSADPGRLTADIAFTGLPANGPASTYTPLALDYRPATTATAPRLVLLLQGPTEIECQLYSIDNRGMATAIGDSTFNCGVEPDPDPCIDINVITPFAGEIDFNPVVDRIRVIGSNTLEIVDNCLPPPNNDIKDVIYNYRLSPENVTPMRSDDTVPAYASGDIGAGTTPAIRGTAYDRNFAGATQTTLFALDLAPTPQRLVTVGGINGTPSPNGGQLTTLNPSSGSGLGVTLTGTPGFDISGATGKAYVSAMVNGATSGPVVLEPRFYELELSSSSLNFARLTRIGTTPIGSGAVSELIGLTVVPATFGLASGNAIQLDSGTMPQTALLLLAGLALLRRRLARRTV